MDDTPLAIKQSQKDITNWHILYELNNTLITASTLNDAMRDVLAILQKRHPAVQKANLGYTAIIQDETGQPAWGEIIAWAFADDRSSTISLGSQYYLADYSISALWIKDPTKPVLIANVNQDSRFDEVQRKVYLQADTQASVLMPLRVAQRWVGLLSLNWPEPQSFQPEDGQFYKTFMQQAAAVIENHSLIDQSQKRIAELSVINEIAQTVTRHLQLDELLLTIYERLQKMMSVDGFFVGLFRPETNMVSFPIIIDRDKRYTQAPRPPKHYIAKTLQTGQPLLENRTPNELEKNMFRTDNRLGDVNTIAKSLMFIPLNMSNRPVGVLSVQSYSLNAYTNRELNLLSGIAHHIAVAIENARLFESTRAQAQQLEALHQVSQDLVSLHNLDVLLHQIVERAIQLLQAESGGIYLYNNQKDILEWAVGVGGSIVSAGETLEKGKGLCGKVWETMASIVVDDYTNWNGHLPDVVTMLGKPTSVVAVPIQWRETFLGVLNIKVSQSKHLFQVKDASLLSLFATQAAIAIQNARLYQETQNQAKQTEQILYTVQDGIILLDQNHRIKLANPAGQEYLLLLANVTIGNSLNTIKHLNITDLLETADRDHLHEIVLNEPLKQIFQISAYSMNADEGGKEWVIVISDVTENRLSQERIQRQDRLAAVGQLAAGIAHDFNNILASIIGFADLMRVQQDVSQSAEKNLEVIIEQGQRAAQLIRQILDFSRQTVPQKEPLDLVPFLETITALLTRTIPENIHITLKITPTSKDYILNTDSTQLQQILTNLAVNARDAMPTGGSLRFQLSRFTLKADEIAPWDELLPGSWIVIAVSDTGVGIPPESYSHLFEPFFTTKDVGQGTGLGLAQVYGIVKQHRGHIKVDSHLGQGTTFTMYFPVQSLPKTPVIQNIIQDIPTGNGQTILLVEDEDIVLSVAKDMLEYLGYQVLTATNGFQAITTFNRYQKDIDLILTDMSMPEIDGLTLTQTLRSRDPALKIVAITGYPASGGQQNLKAQGLSAWLQKPLNLEQLAKTVHQVLVGY